MRVEDLYPQAVRSAEPSGQADRSAEADRARADEVLDTVSLSKLSRALLSYATPKGRLERLHILLASNAYQIPPDELSRRIVDFYLEADGEQPA